MFPKNKNCLWPERLFMFALIKKIWIQNFWWLIQNIISHGATHLIIIETLKNRNQIRQFFELTNAVKNINIQMAFAESQKA